MQIFVFPGKVINLAKIRDLSDKYSTFMLQLENINLPTEWRPVCCGQKNITYTLA